MPEMNLEKLKAAGKEAEDPRAGETEEDRQEVMRRSVLEALEAYRESVDNGEEPDMAKSKGVQRISELTRGEYDDLALPAVDKFYEELGKEPPPAPEGLPMEQGSGTEREIPQMELTQDEIAMLFETQPGVKTEPPPPPVVEEKTPDGEKVPKLKSVEEMTAESARLREMISTAQMEDQIRMNTASQELTALIQEAEKKEMDEFAARKVLDARNMMANWISKDMRYAEDYFTGPDKPLLLSPDNFERYRKENNERVDAVIEGIEKMKSLVREAMGATEPESTPVPEQTPDAVPAEPEKEQPAEAESPEERKARIVGECMDVYQKEIDQQSSVNKAESEAKLKLQELTKDITGADEIGEIFKELERQLAIRERNLINERTTIPTPEPEPVAPPTETTPIAPDQEKEETRRLVDEALEVYRQAIRDGENTTESSLEALGSLLDSLSEQINEIDKLDPDKANRIILEARSMLYEKIDQLTKPPAIPETEPIIPPTQEVKQPPITPEEIAVVEAIARIETPADIEKLPEETREKLGLGFNNLGFFVEENKNRFFAGLIEKLAGKFDQKSTMGRFVSSLAENYRRDQEKAKEKFEDVKQGKSQNISNMVYLGGNALRYGRIAMDIGGYSYNPIKYVMFGAMAFARGSEAAKEARFKNEEAIGKTRVDDTERAENEAWKIYERALEKAGDREISREELNKAFLEGLPEDILARLNERGGSEKIGAGKKLVEGFTRRWIESSMTKLNDKLVTAETEEEKQKLIKKYEAKLNDYNRLVGDYGQIDALATGAKISEVLAKGVRQAMTIETLIELPFAAEKIWADIAGTAGERIPGAEISPLVGEGKAYVESVMKINSADGLDAHEKLVISTYVDEMIKSGDRGDSETAHRLVETYPEAFADRPPVPESENLRELKGFADEAKRKSGELYAKGILGIDITDDISPEEAQKIAEEIHNKEIAGRSDLADSLRSTYGDLKDTSGRKISDLFSETRHEIEPEPTAPQHPESAQQPSPEKILETTGGQKEFSNIILGDRDSIWGSTEDTFRMNKEALGYDPARDGDITAWARKKTAEVMNELAEKEYGGKMPDVVHDDDRVIVYMENGRPHLRFEASSGIKAGHLEDLKPKISAPEKPAIEKHPEETSPEMKPYQPPEAESIRHEPAPEPAKEPEATQEPIKEPAPAPLTERAALVPNEKIAELKASLEGAVPGTRSEIIRDFIMRSPETRSTARGFGQEKINAFSRMFDGDLSEIGTQQKLEDSLNTFDSNVSDLTRNLVDGELDKIIQKGGEEADNIRSAVFPIEASDGKIYYAEAQPKGNWRLLRINEDSQAAPLTRKGFLGRKTEEFDYNDVKNTLGYKSGSEIPIKPVFHEPEIPISAEDVKQNESSPDFQTKVEPEPATPPVEPEQPPVQEQAPPAKQELPVKAPEVVPAGTTEFLGTRIPAETKLAFTNKYSHLEQEDIQKHTDHNIATLREMSTQFKDWENRYGDKPNFGSFKTQVENYVRVNAARINQTIEGVQNPGTKINISGEINMSPSDLAKMALEALSSVSSLRTLEESADDMFSEMK